MRRVRFRDPSGSVRNGTWDDKIKFGGETYAESEVDLLPPVEPTKVICQAGGYQDHRDEADRELPDRPGYFMKGPNAVAGPGDTISLPEGKTVDYEAEFGVVIGEQCRNVPADGAMDVVEGFTCVNDISNRDDQQREQNWIRGKAFDNSLPVGPVVATPDEVPEDARLQLRVNGEVEQETTRDMLIFTVPELIEDITSLITLEPGDVIATGTPYGPDELQDGDAVEIEFDGVGTLEHTVAQ